MLKDVEIGAGKPSFLDRREKRILVHGVPTADIDDNALLRQAANEPRVEEVVGIRIRWQCKYEPVRPAVQPGFFDCLIF